jgi:glycosyltransferase involved in cell wall biosynthesis
MASETELGQRAETPSPDAALDGPGISRRRTVLVVGPDAPPYGGMQLQTDLLRKRLRADGFRVISVASNPPFLGWMRLLERLRGVRPFARAVLFCVRIWQELTEADVVHVMAASWLYFFLVVYPAVLISRLRRKRVVLTYHGGEAERFLSVWGLLAKPAFRMAHVVTAPSGFLKQVLESGVQVPVSIVPNIVNLSAFRYRARSVLAPRMLVARHLEKMYDPASILDAFRRVQECRAEASLWIAGTGSEEARLRSLVSRWNLRNVQFLGHIPHADLPAVYDQCDIFLNASRVDNFPGALLEASAAGLAVITTQAGGIPFLYEHQKNALLVDIGDSAGLALAIEKVLDDPALARKLTKGGCDLAGRFGWSEVRRRVLAAYDWMEQGVEEPNPLDSGAPQQSGLMEETR